MEKANLENDSRCQVDPKECLSCDQLVYSLS